MKKYLLFLLLIGQFSNAQYNLFARQNFAKSASAPTYNTYIGGVSGTISTASALATKLGISVGAISNFTVVGSDIKCKITGSYGIPASAFQLNTDITYYYDNDNLVNSINSDAFDRASNLFELQTKGVLSVGPNSPLRGTKVALFDFPVATSLTGVDVFSDFAPNVGNIKQINIRNVTILGTSAADNLVFRGMTGNPIIYANTALQTNNAGAPDGDLVFAASQGATIRYCLNNTAPSAISDLSAGTSYNTAIQLNFTPPSSTNTIEYYECYANGVFKNRITGSGQYISALTENTNYNITMYAVDIFFNKSAVSNTINITTTNSLSDTDATAYTTASGNTTYQYLINDVFKMTKDNSLYTKIQAFYPFLGTTSTQHKWNAKNPLDTDGAFRLTFNGTATYANTGYTPNGTTGYADTHFVPNTNQTQNSNGITIAVGTNNNKANSIDVGSYFSETSHSFLAVKRNATDKQECYLNGGSVIVNGVNEARGVLTAVRQSSVLTKLIKNRTVIGTGTGASVSLAVYNSFIGAISFTSGTNASFFSLQRIQFVAFHEGLSDSETAILHTIIDTFENAVGRKTW